jgi:hypothetical protein
VETIGKEWKEKDENPSASSAAEGQRNSIWIWPMALGIDMIINDLSI